MPKKIILTFIALFISFVFVSSIKAQCGADCSSCHVLIFEDNDLAEKHMILDTCKNCHEEDGSLKNKSTSILDLNMTPSFHDAGCGGHCSDCHEQYPSDQAHFALNECKNCHE